MVSGAAFAVAGATILGNGRVVLILDVAGLFEGRRHAAGSGRVSSGAAAAAPFLRATRARLGRSDRSAR